MIFTYWNWVSTRWQWSVNLYKNRKETAIYKKEAMHKTMQSKHRIHKIENRHKNKKTNITRILKIISRVIIK